MAGRILVALLALFSSASAFAGSTDTINYQGLLMAPGGSPMNGPVEIIARIWNAPTGGAIQWSELHSSVPVVDLETYHTTGDNVFNTNICSLAGASASDHCFTGPANNCP